MPFVPIGILFESPNNPVYEDESKQIQCTADVTSFSACAQNQRTMLVVGKRSWQVRLPPPPLPPTPTQVYSSTSLALAVIVFLPLSRDNTGFVQVFDASDFSELISMSAPPRHSLLGGCFVHMDKVAVFCSDGVVYLYQLPRRFFLPPILLLCPALLSFF